VVFAGRHKFFRCIWLHAIFESPLRGDFGSGNIILYAGTPYDIQSTTYKDTNGHENVLRRLGVMLVHEIGHYVYGVYDEYKKVGYDGLSLGQDATLMNQRIIQYTLME